MHLRKKWRNTEPTLKLNWIKLNKISAGVYFLPLFVQTHRLDTNNTTLHAINLQIRKKIIKFSRRSFLGPLGSISTSDMNFPLRVKCPLWKKCCSPFFFTQKGSFGAYKQDVPRIFLWRFFGNFFAWALYKPLRS